MKRLVVAAALLSYSGPVSAEPRETGKTGAPAPAAPSTLPIGWKVTTSVEGGFSIAFPPGKSVSRDQELETEAGKIVSKTIMLEMEGGGPVFTATFNDFPANGIANEPQAVLDGALNGAIGNVQGTLASEKEIVLDGHPAREWVIHSPEGLTWHVRAVLVKQRLVQAMVVTQTQKVKDDAEAFRTFLDSLRIQSR